MPVYRTKKIKNFTIMSNYHLSDKNLSLKAKGLLSLMLSLPNNWNFSIAGLCAICQEGKLAIKSTLKELEDRNYLIIEKDRNNKGLFEYTYFIYEEPQDIYQQNCLDIKESVQMNISAEHNKLTLELIDSGYIDEFDKQIIYYDNLFEKLLEEGNSYKDLIKVINYVVGRIIKRGFKDENDNVIENKFWYFKKSIINNIDKIKSDKENLWEDFDISDFE